MKELRKSEYFFVEEAINSRFVLHRRNFMPFFYGASGMFLGPRKTPV
jgi:hypothetical protein